MIIKSNKLRFFLVELALCLTARRRQDRLRSRRFEFLLYSVAAQEQAAKSQGTLRGELREKGKLVLSYLTTTNAYLAHKTFNTLTRQLCHKQLPAAVCDSFTQSSAVWHGGPGGYQHRTNQPTNAKAKPGKSGCRAPVPGRGARN